MAAHQAPPSLGFSRQEHWSGLPFPSPMHESEKWMRSHSAVSDSSRPHELQPTRFLCPWDFPGKSTGVGCYGSIKMIFFSIYIFLILYNNWGVCAHKHTHTVVNRKNSVLIGSAQNPQQYVYIFFTVEGTTSYILFDHFSVFILPCLYILPPF